MTKTQDFTKMMQDMMGAFPMDTSAVQGAWKNQAAMAEKLSRIAIDAAEQSVDISARWTKDTLGKVGNVATVRDETADYSKAVTDFTSSQAESTSETLAAFAEVAKKVQMETVELMLAAGKDVSAQTSQAGQANVQKMTGATTSATDAAADAAKSNAQRAATLATATNK